MVFYRSIPQFGLPFGLSDFPVSRNSLVELEKNPIDPQELVEIVNWRFNRERWALISAVLDEIDFLPISFLELGIRYSHAVCRLLLDVPSFNQNQIEKLLNIMERAEQYLGKKLNKEEWSEVLSIQDSENFFKGYSEYPLSEMTLEKIKSLKDIPVGTGFLVGRNYLMTNHHVIPDRSYINDFVIEFDYEEDIYRRTISPIRYKLDPSFFITSKDLDYTLVRVESGSVSHPLRALDQPGDNFGWIPLIEDHRIAAPPLSLKQSEDLGIVSQLSEKVREKLKRPASFNGNNQGLLGEPVPVIQHPKGRYKQIVLSSNRIQRISRDFLYYETDSDYGSSGSPVFNYGWQLVALNSSAITVDSKDLRTSIIGYEGVRICQIVKNLRYKKKFLEKRTLGKTLNEEELGLIGEIEPKEAQNYAIRIKDFIEQYIYQYIDEREQNIVDQEQENNQPYDKIGFQKYIYPQRLSPQLRKAF